MSTRLTAKQEKFCLNYFKSSNAAASATLAGYSVRSIRSIASELLTNHNIQARLAELDKKAVDGSVMSVLERKQRLTEIARARVSDFVQCKNGVARITVDMDSANSAALEEVTSEELTLGRGEDAPTSLITKLKLRNPVSAIAELNKMEKVYDDAPKVNIVNQTFIQNNLSTLSDDELNDLERIISKAAPLIGTNQAGESAPPTG
jgi:phage terminase small subunit